DVKEHFGSANLTGIVLHNWYLYVASRTSVERYKMTPGQRLPSGDPESIVIIAPETRHTDKGLAFDGKGSLYINIGAPSNACQKNNGSKFEPEQIPAASRKFRRHLEVR